MSRRTRRKKNRARAQLPTAVVPGERVERAILFIRSERVILDVDLAELYGVTTGALNQAVKRNLRRFPPDFRFRLTAREKAQVITNCDHLQRIRFSAALPQAFSEHGAIMAANVLSSDRAVEVSVLVVRAFVRLRQMALSRTDLARRLDDLEQKYDTQFKVVFDALRRLMEPLPGPRRRIGFRAG